jgi:hypothetical protein
MPQLDFREALSAPDEKLFSSPATVTASSAAPVDKKTNVFAGGVQFSRSTWANIFFVTIASAGGLACAFYFFNGGELLRAAAAWPNEFLYPRPFSTDKIDIGQQPSAVDQYTRSVSAPGEVVSNGPFNSSVSNSALTQPAIATNGATVPTDVTGSGSGTSLFSTPGSLIGGLNMPPSGADSLFQSFYQTAVSTAPTKTITRTASSTRSSSRRKVLRAQQKVVGQTRSATSVARSTTQQMQQTSNQTQAPLNAIQVPNQMMMGGGLGGGIGGAVGGVGGGLGGGLGGVGGLGGGLGGLGGLPGHH